MVDAESQDRTRTVYDEDQIMQLQERVSALDAYDNVAVFFNDNGRLLPYEQDYNTIQGSKTAQPVNSTLSLMYFCQPRFDILVPKEKIARMKLGKADSQYYVVKYLPRAHMIAILDESNFRILSRELEFV